MLNAAAAVLKVQFAKYISISDTSKSIGGSGSPGQLHTAVAALSAVIILGLCNYLWLQL